MIKIPNFRFGKLTGHPSLIEVRTSSVKIPPQPLRPIKTLGFTALTMYILTCMIFIACAMLYYGIILFNLRKILKVADSANVTNEKDIKLNNAIVRFDRFIV